MKRMIVIFMTVSFLLVTTGCGSNSDAGNKSGKDRDMLIDTVLAPPATSYDSQRVKGNTNSGSDSRATGQDSTTGKAGHP